MNNLNKLTKAVFLASAIMLTGHVQNSLAADTSSSQSQYGSYGYGMGPGMMGGYGMGPGMMGGYGMGPGMMGGYGMGPGMMGGYGMGPGMMGGYGMGPGMMGGYGMGPGMMGGYGMGPGMMGGYGMGPGMMGGYGIGRWIPDLTDEQQAKINKIIDETRKENWALMGSLQDQQAKLRDLYLAPKPDSNAIGNVYKAMGQLQQKMYESSIDAQKRIDAILTKEQREKLRHYWRRWYGE